MRDGKNVRLSAGCCSRSRRAERTAELSGFCRLLRQTVRMDKRIVRLTADCYGRSRQAERTVRTVRPFTGRASWDARDG
ncbi:MAG: hypothetical protein K1W22_12565 [Lachnospiraceae bacterium]